ncbi:xanthine dehydrogenase small subunit [Afipia felis]|uniref:Carbon monoxide dehydrogenase small chain n=2 Tax=Afipia felis TaxID=1035 RepID=A0A380W629_AFIFE|nr:xanthine dehydrogenase small subunit [Afipia felis]EKS31102.1 xanthine dehydrogenase, small subunit [Afipia felis ATCC 53690]SUU75846.1 Carbon monoxide dehydrogenase small chain [Afipia felis]SUU83913.1 Carbon monoxide dehydrogenase small chain [Afipia felis]
MNKPMQKQESLQALDRIRFYFRGRIHEVANENPTATVLEWLRESAHCTGTKEGCAEGDCGACTVLACELFDPQNANESLRRNVVGGLIIRPVNACIKFLPTLDGCALFTVEDVETFGLESGSPRGLSHLHPVQEAMVNCHGSQCGFCTPGFIMSLTAAYERYAETKTVPSRAQLADDCAGNLCRCTGYRPILDAGQRMFELPPRRLNTKPVVDALQSIRAASTPISVAGAKKYWAPRTVAEFADVRLAHPEARLLAGATDIGLWVNKQMRDVGDLIYIGEVQELKAIEERDGFLIIGAAVRLEDAWRSIASRWPQLRDLWRRFASPPVRHAGTLVGNLANGSPIGDGPPVLIALGAQVQLRRGDDLREMDLQDFYLDYMKNDLRVGEFIASVRIPIPDREITMRAYKVSKRFDSDISAVCGAFSIELDERKKIKTACFVFGGMAAIAKRAAAAEAAAIGQLWTERTLRSIQNAVKSDFKPLTDLRATDNYRWSIVLGLFERFWLETRSGSGLAPLPVEQTTVFAVLDQR